MSQIPSTPFKGKEHLGHDEEHTNWSRRSFLQALGIAGSGSMMLGANMLTANAPSILSAGIAAAETDKILILIRLSGGNDGLSTIIPMQQFDSYATARPNIYIPESKIIKLTDDFGIPSYMEAAEAMWKDGRFKAVHGVGYKNQSLSHFTGSVKLSNTDITAIGKYGENTGWIGRHFENIYPDYLINPPEAPAAIQIGQFGNLVFQGEENNYAFTTSNINQLEEIAESGVVYGLEDPNLKNCMYGDQLKFLRGVANTTYEYSSSIHDAYIRGKNTPCEIQYQNNGFAKQLAVIAKLIKGNLGTKVYMISLGGFDTHGNQPEKHENLMTNLSLAISDFYKDLACTNQDNKVLSMTFSEFGRRIFENGSNGTDHGKAAPTLFFGSGLEGSAFVGEHPTLDNPDNRGNLEYTTDFRDLYATVLAEWLCVDIPLVEKHLLGHPYNPVNLGFKCDSKENANEAIDEEIVIPPTTPDIDNNDSEQNTDTLSLLNTLVNQPYYPKPNAPCIHIEMPISAHVDIQLYNIIGQPMGTIFNEMMFEGSTEINIKERLQKHIATGRYIYRIRVKNEKISKSIMIS